MNKRYIMEGISLIHSLLKPIFVLSTEPIMVQLRPAEAEVEI